MSEFSIKAVLSANASNFVSAFGQAESAVGKLKSAASSVTSWLKGGVLMGIGQNIASSITGGLSEVVSGLEDSSAAWQTFESNMSTFGKSSSEITSVRKELQSFATASIYSASDMASTYSQLAAVGTKDTTNLVKGFGGLAAAASNPTQAMKTLSQQATQAAAKPYIQWQDFKLMMEQTPAGMAAVAKEMNAAGKLSGDSVSDLITAVQSGTVSTEDFFAAISKVGSATDDTGKSLMSAATKYHTVGQAMDGLVETITGVLQPAFDGLSKYAIDALSAINDAIGGIDGEALASRVTSAVDSIMPYLKEVVSVGEEIGTNFYKACQKVGSALKEAFGNTSTIDAFRSALDGVKKAFDSVAQFISDHAGAIAAIVKFLADSLAETVGFIGTVFGNLVDAISPYITVLEQLFGPVAQQFKSAFEKIGSAIEDCTGKFSKASGPVESFKKVLKPAADALSKLAGFLERNADAIAKVVTNIPLMISLFAGLKVVKAVASHFLGFNKGAQKAAETASTAAGAFMKFGAGIALCAAGFFIMVQAATQLASSGGMAIAVFALMVASIAGLVVVISNFSSQLAEAAPGVLAMGGAVLMCAAGFFLMAQAAIQLSNAGTGACAMFIVMVAAIAGLVALVGTFGSELTAAAAGMVAMGAMVIMVAAGFTMLANTAIALSSAGTGACAMFIVMVAAIAGLVAIVSVFSGQLTAAAVGMVALGAMVVLCATGFSMMANAAISLTSAGGAAVAVFFGMVGAIAALVAVVSIFSGGLLVAGAGIAIACAALALLGSQADGLTQIISAVTDSITAIGDAVSGVVDSIGSAISGVLYSLAGVFDSIGNAAVNAGKGMQATADGIGQLVALPLGDLVATMAAVATGIGKIAKKADGISQVGTAMGSITTAATSSVAAVAAISGSIDSMVNGLSRIGSTASSSMSLLASSFAQGTAAANSAGSQIGSGFATSLNSALTTAAASARTMVTALTTAFTQGATVAKTAGTQTGRGYVSGIRASVGSAGSAARSLKSAATSPLNGGYSTAYSSGRYIGMGLANGMRSMLGTVSSIAASLASQANAAIAAKARIGSPSKVTTKYGKWYGMGWINGIKAKIPEATRQAQSLVNRLEAVPNAPSFALDGGYSYGYNADYTFTIPMDIDGRQVARATATYTQDELNRIQTRNNRKRGIR